MTSHDKSIVNRTNNSLFSSLQVGFNGRLIGANFVLAVCSVPCWCCCVPERISNRKLIKFITDTNLISVSSTVFLSCGINRYRSFLWLTLLLGVTRDAWTSNCCDLEQNIDKIHKFCFCLLFCLFSVKSSLICTQIFLSEYFVICPTNSNCLFGVFAYSSPQQVYVCYSVQIRHLHNHK